MIRYFVYDAEYERDAEGHTIYQSAERFDPDGIERLRDKDPRIDPRWVFKRPVAISWLTMEEVNGKGIYGNWPGIRHSVKHGVGTLIVFGLVGESVIGAVILAMIDGLLHYHIDWAKMNWGNRDIQTPAFWAHLGLDQFAHQLVYLLLILLVVGL